MALNGSRWRLTGSGSLLHRPAQLRHACRDTGLQAGSDRLRVGDGLLAFERAVLRHPGAAISGFEGPDESSCCTGQRKLDHRSSRMNLRNAPFNAAGAFAVGAPTRARGEWAVDLYRLDV